MQKWEYKVVSRTSTWESTMNPLGQEGWELVTFDSVDRLLFFKRRPIPAPEAMTVLDWADANGD